MQWRLVTELGSVGPLSRLNIMNSEQQFKLVNQVSQSPSFEGIKIIIKLDF